jgi:hypothetical protein
MAKRARTTIKRAIQTCGRTLINISNRVPLVGFVVAGFIVWFAIQVRRRGLTAIILADQVIFWFLLLLATCFVVLGVAGFIETISARRRVGRRK